MKTYNYLLKILVISSILSVLPSASITIIGKNGEIRAEGCTPKSSSINKKRVDPLEIFSTNYNAGISSKNSNKSTKNIIKVTKNRYASRSNGSKIMYLTFDDGPLQGTNNVLNILKEEGVDATVFYIGKHIRGNRRMYTKAKSMSNILIANHTYSHANGKYAYFYSSKNRVLNDVDRAQNMIGGAKYLRLAGRNVWRLPNYRRNDYAISNKQRKVEIPKYNALSKRGYEIFGWDIEWRYSHSSLVPFDSASTMVEKIESRYRERGIAKGGKMVLLSHDFMYKGDAGAARLRALIRGLRSYGWKFADISSYNRSKQDRRPSRKNRSPLDIFRSDAGRLNEAVEKKVAAKVKNNVTARSTTTFAAKLFKKKEIKIYLQEQLEKIKIGEVAATLTKGIKNI